MEYKIIVKLVAEIKKRSDSHIENKAVIISERKDEGGVIQSKRHKLLCVK